MRFALVLALLFVALAGLYAATAAGTVTFEDSGLFLVGAAEAGFAHPPGYPLYSALAAAMTWLPFGSLAWRVHLLSGLCAAGASCCVAACARQSTRSPALGVFAGALYGVSQTLWALAGVAEVYTLHALLYFATFALALRLFRRFSVSEAVAAAALYGLGLAHHWPLLGLGTPALALLLLPRARPIARYAPLLLGAVALPLVSYGYLWLRSAQGAAITGYGPIESLADLWWTASRRLYGVASAPAQAGAADTLRFLGALAGRSLWELSPMGCALAAIGALRSFGRLAALESFALLAAFASSSLLLELATPTPFEDLKLDQYLTIQVIPWGVACLWAAIALEPLWTAPRRAQRAIAAVAGAAAVTTSLALHFEANDQRQDRMAHDYAEAVLESLPPNADLLLHGDLDTGPIAYVHRVEGVRPDVTLHSQSGALLPSRLHWPSRGEDGRPAVRRLRALIDSRDAVYAPELAEPLAPAFRAGTQLLFNGLLYRIRAKPAPWPADPGLVLDARRLLDGIEREAAGRLWPSLRKRVTFGACGLLLEARIEHRLQESHPACMVVTAHAAHQRGDFARSARLYRRLVAEQPEIYFHTSQWETIRRELFEAEAQLAGPDGRR